MAVPEQIPVVNYVADGIVEKFDVPFEYDQQSDLHVYVDGAEPTIDKYYFDGNAFNFYIAPTSGQNVKIKRITPKERDTDYNLHTNTVRPKALNTDFDRLWYVLQEVFSDVVGLSQAVQDEIIARIQGDEDLLNQLTAEISARMLGDEAVTEDLKNYIDNMIALIIGDPSFNGIDADKVNDASGETQQQVNYNGGSKWHSRVGGYKLNERVVLTNGNIVKSTINGNANNPNVNMTGWVYDPSNVGAKPSDISQPDSTVSGVNSNTYIGGYGVYDPNAETKTRPVWDAIGGVAPGASANALKLTGHVIKDGLDSAINIGGRVGYYNYVGEKGSLSLTYGGDNFNGHLAGIVTAFHCDLISDANGVGSHGIACGGSFAQIAGDYSGSFAGTRKKVFALSSVALGGSSVQIGAITDATLVRRGGALGGLNLSMVAGYESVILGGSANTHTSGNRSATLGGESNEMAANWSAILGGRSIKITADYSVARGWGVVGDIPYASAYNNGYFSTVADNQTYQMMLRRVGVNTSTEVFLSASGGSGVDVYTVKPNQLGLANFDVQGFNTVTNSVYAFNVKVVFSTLGGSLVIKSTTVDIMHDDDKTTSGVEPNIVTTNSFSVTGVSVASGARLGIKITTTAAINSRWTANGFVTVQNL